MSRAPVGASQPSGSALERLHSVLAAEGGLLEGALEPAETARGAREAFGPLAAAGRRAAGAPHDYELLVESILEGYLLHFGQGRIVVPADGDLRLLAGDHLYAFGLSRLAHLGDLEAVEELADLISLCAHVHARAAQDGAEPWPAAASLWSLAALALADGGWAEQREAKRLARAVDPAPSEAALEVAHARAAQLGVTLNLDRALIAFEEAVSRAAPTT